ncbi:hypothetical protein [Hyphomicrobium sp.]|jgi:hypothetical protein|uniref:hypothetical protein n=1 Tax=Hyphomicrobium sp. TaxID=82 RepID=UPI00356463C9
MRKHLRSSGFERLPPGHGLAVSLAMSLDSFAESVAMAANDGEPLPKAENTRSSSLVRRLIASLDVHAFLNAITARRNRLPSPTKKAATGGPGQMMRASEYLEICQEKALDAYTVADALYWHNEIMTELSIELNLIDATSWPQTVKASMTVALEQRLDQHASAVARLVAVLEKNEPFNWQP